MEEKDPNEMNEETRARGVKRNSENKIAEVTTSKKKRAKKATAEAPEPDVAQNLFQAPYERTEEDEKRSRLKECGLPGAVGESVALDYRSGNVPDGQKARIVWLRLYAYSRWKLDV